MHAEGSSAEPAPSLTTLAAPSRRASLRHRLLRGTFWSVLGRVASMGSLILGNIVLAWAWEDSKGDFAAYAIAAAAVVLLGFPATMGVPKILTRLIREGVHTHQPTVLRARLRSAAWLLLGSCAAVTLAMVVGIRGMENAAILGDSDKWRALTNHASLVAAWMALSALSFALSHALMGFDDFRGAALVGARNGGAIANIGFLAAAAIAWATGRLTLPMALWAQAGLNLAAVIAGIWWLRIAMAEHDLRGSHEALEPANSGGANVPWLFRESWPNLVIQLTSMGILPIELLLLSSMADESQIADYRAVQNLQELLVAGQTLATTIVGPFIAELYATRNLGALQTILRGAATLIAIPTLVALVALIVCPELMLSLTFGPEYIGGAWPLRITSIGAAIACFAGPNGLTMIMTGRQRELLKASVLASLIYFAVAPLLIYLYGTIGAAVAVTLVFGTYNIVVTFIVKRRVGIWTSASLSPRAVAAAVRKLREKQR